ALNALLERKIPEVTMPSAKLSDFFGVNVFDKRTMKEFLSKEAFESVNNSINLGTSIDREMAEQIASAMKAWAMSKGVTHYTHWFQPLTGTTAEKHDAFFEPV